MKRLLLLILLFLTTLVYSQSIPYVLLVSFDGFRWDYVNRGLTPNLDMVKKEGVSALSLRPVSPSKTFPNHYSIITGMYADKHGIIFNYFEDTSTGEIYRIGDTAAVRNSKWYKGEAFWETAEKNKITSASYFWPGSEVDEVNRRPTYFERYDHYKPYRERIDGVIDWLKLPYKERPHFITLYFHDTDSYGHRYGPNSEELNKSIQRLDSLVGYIYTNLEEINMADSVNVIFVSDHGMTEISPERTINIENFLKGLDYKLGGVKTFAMIEPSEKEFDEVYNQLKNNQDHYRVYLKNDIPEYIHFKNNDFIYSIILVADLGWSIVDNQSLESMIKSEDKGNHGYEKENLDMHGLFIANGPAFKNDFRTGTIWNIDIYPLLCKIFNIKSNPSIDGKLERVEFLLK